MNKAEFKSTFKPAITTNTSVHEAEMVGVNLIKLLERQRNACAVLRSFSAADKILVDWSVEFGGIVDCAYEITYGDGYKVSGDFYFAQNGPVKPALTRHIRALALAARRGESGLLAHGLKGTDFVFLDRYETNDGPRPESLRTAMPRATSHGSHVAKPTQAESRSTVEREAHEEFLEYFCRGQ